MNRKTTLITFAFLLITSYALAQPVEVTMSGPTKTINTREFAKTARSESTSQISAKSAMRLAAPAPDDIRWIDRINNLPDYMLTYYDKHCQMVQDVLNGDTNYLVDYTLGTTKVEELWENRHMVLMKEYSKKIDYTFPEDYLGNNAALERPYAEEAVSVELQNLGDEVDAFIPYMFMSMDYDNPQAFWLGNSYRYCYAWSYRWNNQSTRGKDYVQLTFRIYFVIKDTEPEDEFDNRIYPFDTPDAIKAGVTEYYNAINEIFKDLPYSATRYDTVRYLNKWLTTHNAYCSNYNPDTSPSIVWSPMSALRGTNGPTGPVCEGYSRAFKILCNGLNIPCVLVVGHNARSSRYSSGESHMWNEVKMDDGQWYAVDVTWNDPKVAGSSPNPVISGRETEKWLLLGKNDIINNNENLTFAESHPNAVTFGMGFQDKWDYSAESFIADEHFDPSLNSTPQIRQDQSVTVYSILGIKLGTFNTLPELQPGIYLINGRKTVVK